MPADEPKLRVLIADDHTVLREAIAEVIAVQPDMELVGQAGDGIEAQTMAKRLRPDVLLMDITMPTVSGLDATLRITVEQQSVKVIGLSMHNTPEMERLMKAVGASAYLTKQCTMPVLLETIRRIAGRGEKKPSGSGAKELASETAGPDAPGSNTSQFARPPLASKNIRSLLLRLFPASLACNAV